MRRFAPALLIVATLSLCGIVAALAGPRSVDTASSVSIDLDVPTRAVAREPARLTLTIENHGQTAIDDVGMKINPGYAKVMTVIETRPLARIDDAPNERRIYFGRLGAGEKASYAVVVAPRSAGDFALTARVVAARRGFEPIVLTDSRSGRAEFTATTTVLPPR
ncbi:MAG: hypothetical protein EPO26_08180 [Chloroflexota bacterium]|nr:MAG: hypothetical protein EPO26_08180 [Chloroflexota bacterium]